MVVVSKVLGNGRNVVVTGSVVVVVGSFVVVTAAVLVVKAPDVVVGSSDDNVSWAVVISFVLVDGVVVMSGTVEGLGVSDDVGSVTFASEHCMFCV